MNNDCYKVETCCTKEKLLVCICACESGVKGEEKVACAYNLLVLYQFAMLLYAGLVENILVELAER